MSRERDSDLVTPLDTGAPHAVHSATWRCRTADERKRVPARFWRSQTGTEPVRDWLHSLSREDRRTIGTDIAMVEFGWPVGMPTCRLMGGGLLEVRSNLANKRTCRVLFCFAGGEMVLLHGFIKKSERTPQEDLEIARNCKREMEK